MAGYQKVILLGNLTRDPELRVTPKGTAICQFGIAINRQYKGEDGTLRDDTTFVDMEAWGKTAENIAKFFSKGKPIFCEGRLKLDQWEDKQSGQKRSRLKVVCEQFQFVGGKDGDGGESRPQRSEAQPAGRPAAANLDEDIPF